MVDRKKIEEVLWWIQTDFLTEIYERAGKDEKAALGLLKKGAWRKGIGST